MRVRFIDRTPRAKAQIKRRSSVALRMMLNDIHAVSTPQTPKDKGDLRKNVLIQVLGLHGVIAWKQRYAAKMNDRQFTNYTTPGTGPNFADDAVNKVVKNAGRYFAKAGLK